MLSTPILAESVDQFLIKISNAMPTDCTLKDQVILFGHVSDHTTIPTVIHPNQTESGLTQNSEVEADLVFNEGV
ncbi:MAG: hypothetical protein NTZ86_05525 [Legionellales bacterium]|nr:hypothetical protein [Legionellales bacterium]